MIIISITIYPDKDYSNILFIQGRRCGKTEMLKALYEAIIISKTENRPVEVDCIMKIIKVME